jgi:hypothetical protein
VSGVEEFGVPQATDCATVLVRGEYASAEQRLMKPIACHALCVTTMCGEVDHICRRPVLDLDVIQRHDELLGCGLFADQPNREPRQVDAPLHAEEPDER